MLERGVSKKEDFMKRALGIGMAMLLLGAGLALAAEKTLTGKISDSMCGASHKSAMEHAGNKMTDHDCVLACVEKGAKFVFVSGGKIYNIENQDMPDLKEHAGHTVKLTGEMTGDTIKATSIEMPKGKS
jgi:hypothetical protein